MPTFKALIIGAGSMGQAWAKNLRDCADVQTVGWMDIRPAAAAEAIAKLELSGITAYDDLGKAIAESGADFVVDVTIPEAHRDVTLAALAAGLPVLGEKPMAHSLTAAREMIAASERAGKLYMVSQSRRYDGRVLAFREGIQQHVGELGILTSDFYLGPHFGGFREKMPSPLLLDMAIHTFDNARQISGRDPLGVYCREFNPSWSWFDGATSATAVFEMTGGLQYTYNGSWCAQGLNTSWHCAWRAFGPPRSRSMGRRQRPDRCASVRNKRLHPPHRRNSIEVGPNRSGRHCGIIARIPERTSHRPNAAGRMPRQHQKPRDGVRGD